ncbi:hypothetical protein BKK49_10175 [Rodentibacter rarus]|uniref:Uncharacterized protein n=1 Tax=Rodentibacter rarus TaxID=1908260 RepID=A0A1V3IQR3_9PAST|nr:hypothetical protein BKK49_10175 [Rodentibacter rarus]OOF44523.1 hypothetical protein BKK50_02470 [Rodentibacter rarus]
MNPEIMLFDEVTVALDPGVSLTKCPTVLFLWIKGKLSNKPNWKISSQIQIEKLSKEGGLKQAYQKTLLPVYGDSVTESDILVEYK